MKRIVGILTLAVAALTSSAQVVSDIRPPADGKMGEFTEWTKANVSWDDGSTAVIEYRVAMAKRQGVGCHYDLEIKNTSDKKLVVRGKSHYYDQLVKSNYGDEAKETLKPGKSVSMRFIAQGCKKEKGTDKDDYGMCSACDFGINIHVATP
jgi:hypothetical protein